MSRLLRRLAFGLALSAVAVVLLVGLTLATCLWRAGQRETQEAVDIAPRAGRFVGAADVEIFVLQAGPESGPVVLFMHGTGAWSETWRESLNALAGAGFRATALDLPPFGHSQRPSTARYSRPDQARRIVGVLDALQVRRAILVGHSFGGGPTIEAALLAPERVRALILVDAALGIRPDGSAAAPASAAVRTLLALTPIRDGVVATFLTNPWFTRRLLAAFLADPAAATAERVAVYQKPLTIRGTTRAVGEWLPELLAPAAPSLSEDPATYRALTTPLTAIWGARDTVTPLAQGERLTRLVSHAKLAILPQAGHIPQIESPREFTQLLVEVVETLHRATEP